ncbi:MAG: radical SAM family heme chaperone HemW [Gammaproteobacteria bacterium]|jgi:oxygen-independent coproporphyrinogen-3 oxidase
MLELPPLSLYIHVPWCIRKCPYCDFNSHAAGGDLPEEAYLAALLNDFRRDREYIQGRPLQSIFIGGGTPSLLSAGFYDELLSGLGNSVNFASDMECTLEANPGTVEMQRFSGFRSAGINRLSLGIQSFSNSALQALGRIHDGAEAEKAIAICQRAGFDNYNLDIMYGLPGQTPRQAENDLRKAIGFAPAHLSWYQLTMEPNTAFYSNPPQLPDEDTLVEIMESGFSLLEEAGLNRYEISAYARPGRPSRHNLNYWQFGDYLGIGAGASGKITFATENRLIRTRKVRQPNHYLSVQDNYAAEVKDVEPDSLDLEFLMNALRLINGFETDLYQSRTGKSFGTIRKRLEYLQQEGFLQVTDSSVRPTAKGVLFTNNLLENFL